MCKTKRNVDVAEGVYVVLNKIEYVRVVSVLVFVVLTLMDLGIVIFHRTFTIITL